MMVIQRYARPEQRQRSPGDVKSTERAAATAQERAQQARLALKKAKKEASKAFTKATARVTRAEEQMSTTDKAGKKRVAAAAGTKRTATKVAAKKTVGQRSTATRVTPRSVAAKKRATTEPPISAVEPSDEPDTFILGESAPH